MMSIDQNKLRVTVRNNRTVIVGLAESDIIIPDTKIGWSLLHKLEAVLSYGICEYKGCESVANGFCPGFCICHNDELDKYIEDDPNFKKAETTLTKADEKRREAREKLDDIRAKIIDKWKESHSKE